MCLDNFFVYLYFIKTMYTVLKFEEIGKNVYDSRLDKINHIHVTVALTKYL